MLLDVSSVNVPAPLELIIPITIIPVFDITSFAIFFIFYIHLHF